MCSISVVCEELHGVTELDRTTAPLGTFVTLTIVPDSGFEIYNVTTKCANNVLLDKKSPNVYHILVDSENTVITVSFIEL